MASYGGGFSYTMAMLAGSCCGTTAGAAEAFRLVRPSILEKLNVDELGLEVGLVLLLDEEVVLLEVVVMVVAFGLEALLAGTIGEVGGRCCSRAEGSSLMASS